MAEVCNGIYFGAGTEADKEITAVVTDSRKIEKGCLFAAIKGERVDGHDFIEQAYEKGALCVISEKTLANCKKPYIMVDSTVQALQKIAEFYRKGLDIKVVGITGSVGKTSTKEMIASVLSEKYKVLKTQGNFNNGLGLPLTIFGLTDEDEIAVLEMGISDFGEMHLLSKIARPDICVFTNIGICHLEQLHTRDGILKAKTEMFDYMAQDGSVIINGDDDKLCMIEAVKGREPYRYGMSSDNDVYLKESENLGLKGTRCVIGTPQGDVQAVIPIPGRHMIYNAMAGAMTGILLGLNTEEIKAGIEHLESLAGRNHIVETSELTIIDDCYNANPVSMKASVDVVQSVSGRKVCILGDMGELGVEEASLHQEVGRYVAESGVDLAVFIGNLARYMRKGYETMAPSGNSVYFESVEEFLAHSGEIFREKDTVLVKASHFMKFDRIVDYLTNYANVQ
jgi:UDP-N-acetylmuramoyl-tripeptide--D-alanyl-D-alanine ligase